MLRKPNMNMGMRLGMSSLKLGPELVINGNFDVNIGPEWADSSTAPSAIAWNATNKELDFNFDTNPVRGVLTVTGLTIGKNFKVLSDNTHPSNNCNFFGGTTPLSTNIFATLIQSNSTKVVNIAAPTTTIYLSYTSSVHSFNIDNISVKQIL